MTDHPPLCGDTRYHGPLAYTCLRRPGHEGPHRWSLPDGSRVVTWDVEPTRVGRALVALLDRLAGLAKRLRLA
jgi:hypothetical protein